jgi:kumamolisin
MGRARHLAALAALLVAGTALHPGSAAAATGTSTVVLSLAQRPGAASALHQLARTALAPAAHGAAAARAATDRRTALARLAPDATHQDAVVAFARAHGLQVLRADGWSVTLDGPADTLARLFGTTLAHGRAAAPPVVPASLRADVTSVVGLDDRPLLRPRLVPGLTSAALRLQYGVPLTGWSGSGVTVGTLNLTGWDPTDLTTYAGAALLPLAPGQITTVPVDNPPNPLVPDGSGNDIEVAMDAQAILAAAPQARQRMYFAPNNGVGTVDAFNQMAADGASGLLQVASTSWGLCERDLQPYPTYVAQVGQAIDRMLAAGVTLFAASGDAGIYGCSRPSAVDNTLSVDFPASYPGTVAVGGTRLGLTETAWGNLLTNPGTAYAGNGSGGGRSALFGRPSYQVGVGGSETQRLVPDVASVADPSTGLGIYNVGSWLLGGGTSLGAPTWAGLTAAALSGAGRTSGLGDVHGLLYAHPEGFRDITSGSNGYPAGTGFDLATGLGTPVWSTLGPLVTSSAAPPAPAPAAPAPAPPAPADTAAPTSTAAAILTPGTDTRVRFSWAGRDPVPSAGLGPYRVQVNLLGSSTVWATTTAATAQVLRLVPGRTYVLTVRSSDLAGHIGPATAARVTVPLEDTSFVRAGSWSRIALVGDYLGAHLRSRTRGSAVAATVYGRTITLGFVRAPYAGFADVYVDGVRVRRLDLWASTTLRRQTVRVLAATRPARHTARVVVVGAHRAGATGNWVMPDSLLAVP